MRKRCLLLPWSWRLLLVCLLVVVIDFGHVAAFVAPATAASVTPSLHYCHNNQKCNKQSQAVLAATEPTRQEDKEVYDEGIVVDVPRHVLDEKVHNQIEDWIQQRADARWRGDYETADKFRDLLLHNNNNNNNNNNNDSNNLLPAGTALVIRDIPRTQGGGSEWSLVYDVTHDVSMAPGPTVLQIAHSALGMAVSLSRSATRRRGDHHNTVATILRRREELIEQAMGRLNAWSKIQDLIESGVSIVDCMKASTTADSNNESNNNDSDVSMWLAVKQELRGRKASDAAFWYAMAGVEDANLYEKLLHVGLQEAQRFGDRPSCRTKDLWAIVDRFSAAGVLPTRAAIQIFSCLLNGKREARGETISDHNAVLLDDQVMERWQLHSDSCALLIWKFSTRQRKQRDFLATAARHWESQVIYSPTTTTVSSSPGDNLALQKPKYNWKEIFKDPERPLVIDIGCGQGLSLLGIASLAKSDEESRSWEHCNFLGIDLSALAIGYARCVSKRWELSDVLHFAMDTAEEALKAVEASYPGSVSEIMIQFPTPYRLLPTKQTTSSREYQGNTQLPKAADDGFMVSENLLLQVASLLRNSCGSLLLQSNCEDVALYMASIAKQRAGMVEVVSSDPRWQMPEETTQRTDTWLAAQTNPPGRAAGLFWWNSPVLPRACQTETEIACSLNGTPVHRLLLRVGP